MENELSIWEEAEAINNSFADAEELDLDEKEARWKEQGKYYANLMTGTVLPEEDWEKEDIEAGNVEEVFADKYGRWHRVY